jgi:hypothetical protein
MVSYDGMPKYVRAYLCLESEQGETGEHSDRDEEGL